MSSTQVGDNPNGINHALKFCSFNVENLVTKLCEPDFVNYVKSFDIFCAIETFTNEHFDFGILFNDFHVFHSPAVKLSKRGRRSGGVAIFCKKTVMPFVTHIDCEHDNMICIRISKEVINIDKDILFVSIYVPPYQSPYYRQKEITCTISLLEDFLLNLYEKGESAHLVVGGDFNARTGDWSLPSTDQDFDIFKDDSERDNARQSKDKCTNQFAHIFYDFCTIFQCTPLNGHNRGDPEGEFTFVSAQGNSVIDYFVASYDFVSKVNAVCEVGSRVESSHMPVTLTIERQTPPTPETSDTLQKESTTKIKWNPDRAQSFTEEINSEESQRKLQNAYEALDSDVDLALNMFTETLLDAGECMKQTIWFNTGTERNTNKWFDRECLMKKREARRALNKFQRSGSDDDGAAYKEKRSEYKSLITEKKKQFKVSVQQTLVDNKRNGTKFWDTVRNARQKRKKHVDIGIDEWMNHFREVLNEAVTQPQAHEADTTNESNFQSQAHETETGGSSEHETEPSNNAESSFIPEMDDPISEQEVRDAIRNLKNGKAAGIDEICGEFLKYSENLILPFLTKAFNKIYDISSFPSNWCKSIIIPLFKKGDDRNPDNYRGISLLSIISKVFTAVLNKRLYAWAEKEEKISKEQAGFRKGYSTIDHIFTLVSIIKKKLNSRRGGKVYAAFIDYRKAFDSVDRDKLWETLQKLETSSKMVKMVKAMYSSVQCCVRWGAKVSDFFDCSHGVKQGCLLSPIIFSLLISKVADFVRRKGKHGIQLLPGFDEIFLLLFADDIVLLSSTPSGLQNQINSLESVSKTLGLTVNLDKTKTMVFRKGGHLSAAEKWTYGNKEIETVNSYKYLGFTLTTKLSCNYACGEYASKAKAKILDLMRTMWSLCNLDSSVFFQLFDAQIKPMLLYASEIWGISRLAVVESAHLFACKRFLGVSNRTPNHMIYGETGRYPLFIESTVSSLRYWLKLKKMPMSRLPKQALVMLENDLLRNDPHKNSWIKSVKDTLFSLGFQDAWSTGVTHERAFLLSVKRKMIDNFKQEWFTKISSSERFATYRLFKQVHQSEKYVNDLTIKKFRDPMIRLRLGINELGVNKRYQHGADVIRDCPFCPGVLEDENHFMFSCEAYKDLREKYLVVLTENSEYPCIETAFVNQTVDVNRKIAMYTFYALKHREELQQE